MITQAYVLNQTNQLIDINDVYTSFTTLMNVTCENLQDSFEYAIINQSTLDSNQFKFKKVTGFWEDTFTINQENFQNWYLVLKSDKDIKCTLNLNITPLDYNTDPPQQPNTDALSQVRPSPKNSVRERQPKQPPVQQQMKRPQRPVQRPQQRPTQPRPVKRPVESDDDDDEEDEYYDDVPPPKSTSKYYKYIMYGLIGIAVLLVALWWTGYIYKVPYLNKLFVNTVIPAPKVHLHHPPPPPVVVHLEPVHDTNTNFINEMRELKIDL